MSLLYGIGDILINLYHSLLVVQSVGYTAAPFIIIALVWFVFFGLSLSLICLCYCCCARQSYGYSRVAYALSLILLISFTIAAM